MYISRRRFLHTGAVAVAGTTFPWSIVNATSLSNHPQVDRILQSDSADFHTLLDAAVESAKAAGAEYADVRLQAAKSEIWNFNPEYLTPLYFQVTGVGVRALVQGYWGFAGLDGLPSLDAMAQLGREAVRQANTAAQGTAQRVELAQAPVVTGEWTTPIEIDPFTIDDGTKVDFGMAITDVVSNYALGVGAQLRVDAHCEECMFASSEGSFTRQRQYRSGGMFRVGVEGHFSNPNYRSPDVEADFLTTVGAGWEYLRELPSALETGLDEIIETARVARLPKPVDIGRYDVVFDARTMANILDGTIGEGTRLDRAMGFEANAEGTSFLGDPQGMLGAYQLASPRITISANRSMPRGTATVRWDDEGVVPEDVTLVEKGMLTDFQTSRESASWLAEYYARSNRPVRSHGGAGSDVATLPPAVRSANLVWEPNPEDVSFADLVADTEKGLAVIGGTVDMDQQCLNGAGYGIIREIVNGKLGQVVSGASYLFRAPEFWKRVVGFGGASSVKTFGLTRQSPYRLGATLQGFGQVESHHSIAAVPAKVTDVPIIDIARKAPEPVGA